MKNNIWYGLSITHKITLMVCALCSISILGMIISLYISENIQGRTHVVNQIGSIRMQTYKLLSQLSSKEESSNTINIIEHKLTSPSFKRYVSENSLILDYKNTLNFFDDKIKPIYSSQYHSKIETDSISSEFINRLNTIINKVESNTENNIRTLRGIQYLFIFIVISFGYITITNLRHRLFNPWKELLNISKSIQKGDFNKKYETSNYKDEMNELGSSINSMSDSLHTMYTNLEEMVYDKTEELNKQNKYLEFLYRTCQTFNREKYSCENLSPLVKELMTLTGIRKIHILILDSQESDHVQNFHFGSNKRPEFCSDFSCHLCFDEEKPTEKELHKLTHFLRDPKQEHGQVDVYIAEESPLDTDEKQLLAAFCDLLTQSLSLYYKEQQEQQLLLLKERNTIARELHDSIAQSLSCLKIKASILQMDNENLSTEQVNILGEMRNELNVAYSQLRELLTTFRLKLDGVGFVPALKKTISEYKNKLNTDIKFEYNLPANIISIHQSIHLLQIIREALNNIYKHADASEVVVKLDVEKHEVSLFISDDGIGFSTYDEHSHYGLKIIGDRAQSLSGSWNIESSPGNGTTFYLTFPITTRESL